ncbi:MAG TPA: M14 family metallopeptidase [Alphaproteobacteria bacterium]|jgi:hypothetical protein|nr:M14 family metallopeptidase [Alphaproteobacteria bacterium]
MSVSQHFSADYAEARAKFLAAARAAGAEVASYDHPLTGPDGGALALDMARLGPADAPRALLLSSATHGVEGFCGSGCQVAALAEGFHGSLPEGMALVLVHAHNPHGFAHIRRVTEDNIDLNRNFVDFDQPLPENAAYDEVHPLIVPADWDGPARKVADEAIMRYIEERGLFAWQAAVTGGQWSHPDGIFYGGQGPSWSRLTIERMARERLAGHRFIGLIDFHTGLGPRGHGEIIGIGAPGHPNYERARQWYGEEAKSPEAGDSVSAVVRGTTEQGYVRSLPGSEVTGIAVEYGTLPPEAVLQALRADNWLHLKGDVNSPQGREIKQQVRDAFYGDDDQWKADVWQRAEEVMRRGVAGLAAVG